MKGIKKTLAVLLAVCMLVGMPLSVNVGAAEALKVAAAVQVPASIASDSNSSGLDANKSVALYFNKNVAIDLSKTGAVIVQCNAQGKAVNYWKATITANTAYGSSNNYVVTINPDVNQTIGAVVESAKTHAWATRAVVRLFDKTTGIDNFVGGVTSGSEKLAGATPYAFGGCQTNGNINATTLANNVCDFYEAEITTADSMPKITGAEWTSELGVKVTYSHPVSNAGRVWGGVRLVNGLGQLMCWLPDSNTYVPLNRASGNIEYLQSRIDPMSAATTVQTFTLGQKSAFAMGSFAANSVKNYSWFNAHLEACRAADPSGNYQLAYFIEESSSTSTLGEAANNRYISGLYTADGKPLAATSTGGTLGKDVVIMLLTDWDKVEVTNIDIVSDTKIEVEFSHPVTLNQSAYYGLRVIDPALGNLFVGSNYGAGRYQHSLPNRVSKSGNTYDTVWVFTASSSITTFVRDRFFFDKDSCYTKYPLCFAVEEAAGAANDGVMQAITTEDGKCLYNPNKTTSGRENFYMSVLGDDFLHMNADQLPVAVLADDTQIFLTTKGVSSTAFGGKVYLRAYNSQGQLLKLNGQNAQWQVALSKVETSGTCYQLKGSIATNHGTNKYSRIMELLDAQYDDFRLELVVTDTTTIPGVCENLSNYGTFRLMPANALYSTETEDVGVIELTQNIVSVTDVELINDMSSADGNKYVIVTFSHDIDMDALMAVASSRIGYLFTSAYGLNNWINSNGTVGGSMPADQAPIEALAQYGNAGNKVIGKVAAHEYAQLMNNLAKLEAEHPSDTYEYTIRARLEFAAGYAAGKLPLNYNIKALDPTVLSPYMHEAWSNNGSGRIYANVDGTAAPMDMVVEQLSDYTLRVTFGYWENGVFMPEAVTVNDSINKPYVGLRMVNTENILIYGHRDSTGTTLASQVNGKAMQWAAQSYEMLNDTQMLVTFSSRVNISDIMDKSNMPPGLVDYDIKFVIEESVTKNGVTDEACKPANAGVYAITSKNNPNRQLACDMIKSSGHWDGAYASFEPLDPTAPIEVKGNAATITGENRVTFEWTEAVKMESFYSAFRYVDPTNGSLLYYDAQTDTVGVAASHTDASGATVNHTPLQFAVVLEFADASQAKMTGRLSNSARYEVRDLADLLEPAADSEWGRIMAKYDGAIKLCIEEKANNLPALIDTFYGVDGKSILAQPVIGGQYDGVYMDVTGDLIVGELSVTGAKAVSDSKIIVSFSAPVQVLKSAPFAAIRAYNENNQLLYYNTLTQEYTTNTSQVNADGVAMYTDANGNPTTEAVAADGTKNTRISNIPMQWNGAWSYANDEHTQLAYVISGRTGAPNEALVDVLLFDWSSIGAYIAFAIEESGADMVVYDNHVNNIVRADDPTIALDGNFFPYDRDNCRVSIEMGFTPVKLTAKATVISDTQIRVSFSAPVKLGNTFIAVRMLDKDGNLMYNDEKTVAYQWSGTVKMESEANTSLIWTFAPNNSKWGATSLYDLLNWKGTLEYFKDEARMVFCIEEKDTADLKVGRLNRLLETVSTVDGANHLAGNAGTGYDALNMEIGNVDALSGDPLTIESVTATDEKTIKLKFNRGVAFKEGDEAVSMAIRYLSPSGDSEVLTDGKTAIFKGDWAYDGNDKSTVIWTLNSKHTDSLTEILTYAGKFEWNKGARCAFIIMDENEEYYCPMKSMRINGVTDVTGVHHLQANYSTEDAMMAQMDITVAYDLPVAAPEVRQEIEYYTNYKNYIITASVVAAAIVVVAVVVGVSKKKEN